MQFSKYFFVEFDVSNAKNGGLMPIFTLGTCFFDTKNVRC